MLTLDKYPNVNRQIEKCIEPDPALYVLNFDGVNDYITNASYTGFDVSQPFTIFAKFKADVLPDNYNLLSTVRALTDSRGFLIRSYDNFNGSGLDAIGFQFTQSAGPLSLRRYGIDFSSTDEVTIQFTYDGTLTANTNCFEGYIDGVAGTKRYRQIGSNPGTILPDSGTLRIGARSESAANYFDGFIKEISIVDYEKTPAEVLADYNAGTQSEGSGSYLVCIKPLYDGTVNRAIQSLDSTVNAKGCAGLGEDYIFSGYPNPLVLGTNLTCFENC